MRWGFAIFGLMFQVNLFAPVAMADTDIEIAKRVIIREICFSTFWTQNDVYRLGANVPIQYKSANGKIYVWSDQLGKLSTWEKRNRVVSPLRQYVIFPVVIQGNEGLWRYSTNPYFQTVVFTPGDEEKFAMQIAGLPGEARSDHLQVPSDCTPRSKPSSLWREQAIGKIMAAVRTQAKWMPWHGQPTDLKVVISDFDWYSDDIFVYVPSLNITMTISSRGSPPPKDITAWDDLFVAMDPGKPALKWTRAMLKYGVTRTIHWDAKP